MVWIIVTVIVLNGQKLPAAPYPQTAYTTQERCAAALKAELKAEVAKQFACAPLKIDIGADESKAETF